MAQSMLRADWWKRHFLMPSVCAKGEKKQSHDHLVLYVPDFILAAGQQTAYKPVAPSQGVYIWVQLGDITHHRAHDLEGAALMADKYRATDCHH